MEVSLREFSRRAGVTLRAVQIAHKYGKFNITRTEQHGKRTRHFIDLETELENWNKNRNIGNQRRPTRAELGRGPQRPHTKKGRQPAAPRTPAGPPGAAAEKKDGQSIFGNEAYNQARTARELYNAKTAELEYKEKSGELVPIDKVREIFFSTGAAVQRAILQIPARVAPILAADSSEKKILEVLTKELKESLKSISEGNLDFSQNAGN